ncbi:MAG: hypothetical protein QM763_03895 [Agriterribacter sp.]
MKKIFLPLLIAMLFSYISFKSFSRQSQNNYTSALSVVQTQPDAVLESVNYVQVHSAQASSVNCDVYLALIATLQERLKYASPSQKPGILAAIAKARNDYRNCVNAH